MCLITVSEFPQLPDFSASLSLFDFWKSPLPPKIVSLRLHVLREKNKTTTRFFSVSTHSFTRLLISRTHNNGNAVDVIVSSELLVGKSSTYIDHDGIQ